MNMPLVSVIIPTYNRAYCIVRTIEGALAQTHSHLEIIVVDDGSTDNTGELLAEKYGHDPRIRYISQSNTGVAGARNTGIRAARGEFVALLDSDDVWFPWKLELQVAALQKAPEAGMVWTDMEAIDPDGNVFSRRYLRTMYDAYMWFQTEDLFPTRYPLAEFAPGLTATLAGTSLYVGDIFSQMMMGSLVHTSTVLLRRERLEQVRGFREELKPSGEDYDFHLRTCRQGPVAFLDVASMQYQCGMVDRLTRPAYRIHMATNFLKVILPYIEHERDRIRLPDWMIHRVLADAYSWIGEEAYYLGDRDLSRSSFAKSLRHRPLQWRTTLLAIRALLPPAIAEFVMRLRRALSARPQVSSEFK